MLKSPSAPALTVAREAESPNWPGWTISGMLTFKGSLQLANGASDASPTSAISLDVFVMVWSSGSEGHVDAGEELPHRRLCQEVGLAEIELGEHGEVPEEVHVRRQRGPVGGHRRALERVRVTERDLGRLDQAIAAGIGKRVRGTPVAACRVPDLVALRGAPEPEDDRGPDGVGLEHAIPVPPRAGGDVPLDVRVPHQLSGQEQLIAFVADLAG